METLRPMNEKSPPKIKISLYIEQYHHQSHIETTFRSCFCLSTLGVRLMTAPLFNTMQCNAIQYNTQGYNGKTSGSQG